MQPGQGLMQGGQVRRKTGALFSSHAQHLELAAFHERHHPRKAAEGDRHLTGHHIGGSRRCAAIGDMHQVQPGPLIEHHAQQVVERAVARRGIVDAAGAGLGVLDQFLERVGRKLRMRHQQIRGRSHRHDRLEILDRIKARIAVERRIDGLRTLGGQHQGMAILGRTRGRSRADIAACAGAVLHHHRLADGGGKALRKGAGHRVIGTPCSLRHDEGDRLGGPGLLSAGQTR